MLKVGLAVSEQVVVSGLLQCGGEGWWLAGIIRLAAGAAAGGWPGQQAGRRRAGAQGYKAAGPICSLAAFLAATHHWHLVPGDGRTARLRAVGRPRVAIVALRVLQRAAAGRERCVGVRDGLPRGLTTHYYYTHPHRDPPPFYAPTHAHAHTHGHPRCAAVPVLLGASFKDTWPVAGLHLKGAVAGGCDGW